MIEALRFPLVRFYCQIIKGVSSIMETTGKTPGSCVTLDSLKTRTNVDCTSFNPFLEHKDTLLVGKYQLDKDTQKVYGGYSLYNCSTGSLNRYHIADALIGS